MMRNCNFNSTWHKIWFKTSKHFAILLQEIVIKSEIRDLKIQNTLQFYYQKLWLNQKNQFICKPPIDMTTIQFYLECHGSKCIELQKTQWSFKLWICKHTYGELNQKLKQVEFCFNAMIGIVLNFKRLMKFEAMNM
jgi:hypothetical protein